MSDNSQTTTESIRDAREKASQRLDESLASASAAVRSGSAQATQAYGSAYRRAETFLDTGLAHAQSTEQYLFDRLKVGVEIAMENPTASYAACGGAAVLLLPGLRGFLFRKTFGRFRSEEGIVVAAERKSKDVKERVAYFASEGTKLDSRLTNAIDQWQTGLSKTQAAAKQLASLAGQVNSIEKSAQKVLTDLRYVSKKDALRLRSEVAMQLAAAQQQRRAIEKVLWGLTKKGL